MKKSVSPSSKRSWRMNVIVLDPFAHCFLVQVHSVESPSLLLFIILSHCWPYWIIKSAESFIDVEWENWIAKINSFTSWVALFRGPVTARLAIKSAYGNNCPSMLVLVLGPQGHWETLYTSNNSIHLPTIGNQMRHSVTLECSGKALISWHLDDLHFRLRCMETRKDVIKL